MSTPWTEADFTDWLNARPSPHLIVGWAGSGCHCPLASWRAALGERLWVGSGRYGIWDDSAALGDLPDWAHTFAAALDRQYRHSPVTAQQCLDILGSVNT